MKPFIGITAGLNDDGVHQVKDTYVQAVLQAGGIPVIVPTGTKKYLDDLINKLDGFLFTGGGDVDPFLFDEEPHPKLGAVEPERDALEFPLVKAIIQTEKPILAICRGMQMLTIAFGGGVYQDLSLQKSTERIQHQQQAPVWKPSHFVSLTKGSLLEELVGKSTIRVNSFHHQAVKNVRPPLQISAMAKDGTIEAIESTTHPFVIGVQWHPEALLIKKETVSQGLFKAFIQKSKESRQ